MATDDDYDDDDYYYDDYDDDDDDEDDYDYDDDGGRSCSALAPRPSARLSLPTLTAPRLSLTDTDRLLDAKKRSAVIMS